MKAISGKKQKEAVHYGRGGSADRRCGVCEHIRETALCGYRCAVIGIEAGIAYAVNPQWGECDRFVHPDATPDVPGIVENPIHFAAILGTPNAAQFWGTFIVYADLTYTLTGPGVTKDGQLGSGEPIFDSARKLALLEKQTIRQYTWGHVDAVQMLAALMERQEE
jgi:hypothetical protein